MVQMVRVLALNKLDLKDMINTEVVENPVLEEIEDHSQSLDEMAGEEGDRERTVEEQAKKEEKDPFDEVDFGDYFKEYGDPGFKSPSMFEEFDKPSFEHFLSSPTHLDDHLQWQLGAMSLSEEVRRAVEYLIGNLDEKGYLVATDDELQNHLLPEDLEAALNVLHQLDPIGVGARDLKECLRLQAEATLRDVEAALTRGEEYGFAPGEYDALCARKETAECALKVIQDALPLLERGDMREVARKIHCKADGIQAALTMIRTFDPRPGLRYNQSETRLIEPDVAFVKRDDDYVVVMNEEDMPALRLNAGYRRMLHQKGKDDKELREYVKERYRSAIQLLRNIEQRKNTIVRVCETIVRRQKDFLEKGVDALRPMMIKEVAEEIGVHPSTVSRAVSNKYVHTAQGVYELRFFFSEGVNGPEGGDLPLLLLKKKVKALIEAEDPAKPLTDDVLAAELQRQGIQVTRRTVAKYREDMQIPSTHRRRRRA